MGGARGAGECVWLSWHECGEGEGRGGGGEGREGGGGARARGWWGRWGGRGGREGDEREEVGESDGLMRSLRQVRRWRGRGSWCGGNLARLVLWNYREASFRFITQMK